MSKEYEKIRAEVHKKYRHQIDELTSANQKLCGLLLEKEKECKELRRQLNVAEREKERVETPYGILGALGVGNPVYKSLAQILTERMANEHNGAEESEGNTSQA